MLKGSAKEEGEREEQSVITAVYACMYIGAGEYACHLVHIYILFHNHSI
jgi:hypothetical protein